MFSVADFYDIERLMPTALCDAAIETQQAILIVVDPVLHHPSHSNIILRSALARQASAIPHT